MGRRWFPKTVVFDQFHWLNFRIDVHSFVHIRMNGVYVCLVPPFPCFPLISMMEELHSLRTSPFFLFVQHLSCHCWICCRYMGLPGPYPEPLVPSRASLFYITNIIKGSRIIIINNIIKHAECRAMARRRTLACIHRYRWPLLLRVLWSYMPEQRFVWEIQMRWVNGYWKYDWMLLRWEGWCMWSDVQMNLLVWIWLVMCLCNRWVNDMVWWSFWVTWNRCVWSWC